jgi:hypothetical protein
MSEEPFFYFFVDEHKIVTVRVEAGLKEQVERLMAAFDLEQNEDAAGVDAAAHEHRSVLVAPEDDPRMLGFDEVVERLRDDWRLVLNINPETNVDDEDRDLGPTGWWCRVRVEVPVKAEQAPEGGVEPETLAETRYVEVVLVAECLREAEEEAILAAEKHAGLPSSALKVESLDEDEEDGLVPPFVVFADRMSEDQLETQRKSAPKRKGPATGPGTIISVKWAD